MKAGAASRAGRRRCGSFEDWDGRLAARFYGAEVCRLSRPERISFCAHTKSRKNKAAAVEAWQCRALGKMCEVPEWHPLSFTVRFAVSPRLERARRPHAFSEHLIYLEEKTRNTRSGSGDVADVNAG